VFTISGEGTPKSDYFYEDASFVRLRNISLKFDLTHLVAVSALRKVQLELAGRNLLTVTNYSGMDPEINSGQLYSSWDRGIDNCTLPNMKSYQVSLSLGF
jgi:hypothetical protein